MSVCPTCGVNLTPDDTIPCETRECGVHVALNERQDAARALYGSSVEIISQRSTQVGPVTVNFTVGRIK